MRSSTVVSKDRVMRRPVLLAVAGALLLAAAPRAMAGACGDDLDGARVACACGDIVVSDTVLWATDPVVTETCSGDGLLVQAPVDADGITLDLDGQSLAGRGYGTGIRIVRGGRLGAVLVGGGDGDARAEIANFGTGIRASGRNVLREVRSLDVHDNQTDGLSLHSSGVTLADVRSERNGRHGVSLTGHDNSVANLAADSNARDGLNLGGSSASVEATSTGNGRNGVTADGRGHRLSSIRTGANGGAGVSTNGGGHEVHELPLSRKPDAPAQVKP